MYVMCFSNLKWGSPVAIAVWPTRPCHTNILVLQVWYGSTLWRIMFVCVKCEVWGQRIVGNPLIFCRTPPGGIREGAYRSTKNDNLDGLLDLLYVCIYHFLGNSVRGYNLTPIWAVDSSVIKKKAAHHYTSERGQNAQGTIIVRWTYRHRELHGRPWIENVMDFLYGKYLQ